MALVTALRNKIQQWFHSLAFRLTVGFWLVAFVGTMCLSTIIGIRIADAFDQFIVETAPLATQPDTSNEITIIPPSTPDPVVIRRIERDGQVTVLRHNGVFWDRWERGSPHDAFEVGVNRAIASAVCASTFLALLLAFALGRLISRPLRQLTQATELLALGELGHQVKIQSKNEIGRLAVSFNKMSADLSNAVQLRRQMTADIAHDLRTPLSIISGYTEALQQGKLKGTPQMYEVIHTQVKHLNHLIEDLRTLSLADAGELSLNKRAIDPMALLERTLLAHIAQAEEQGVTLQLDMRERLPAIQVDVERFSQVLSNLVINALRYTPIGGTVTLSAQETKQDVQLQVRDTGTGIPVETLPHIFDRFYRDDESRQRPQGESGLGLAIAKSIVEAHAGNITVNSTLERGTTFTIAIPKSLKPS